MSGVLSLVATASAYAATGDAIIPGAIPSSVRITDARADAQMELKFDSMPLEQLTIEAELEDDAGIVPLPPLPFTPTSPSGRMEGQRLPPHARGKRVRVRIKDANGKVIANSVRFVK